MQMGYIGAFQRLGEGASGQDGIEELGANGGARRPSGAVRVEEPIHRLGASVIRGDESHVVAQGLLPGDEARDYAGRPPVGGIEPVVHVDDAEEPGHGAR